MENQKKVIGIIAEYNPFHNGHAYQIQRAKEMADADFVVVLMSGHFTQRGEPAIFNSHTRTKMALLGGADAVFEMPAPFSCASAEDFASYGINLFGSLGIPYISFGTEGASAKELLYLASLLKNESPTYQLHLKELLLLGSSFPQAREGALLAQMKEDGLSSDERFHYKEILQSPNNILGIEYIKAKLNYRSPILPIAIPRMGSSYHDTSLPKFQDFASASAIRNSIFQHHNDYAPFVPHSVLSLLKEAKPLPRDILCDPIFYRILMLQYDDTPLSHFFDVSHELSRRIINYIHQGSNYEEFITNIKPKQYTFSRVSRALLHIFLGITKKDMLEYKEGKLAPYARLIGFKKESSDLLTQLKKNSSIPIISKLADANHILSTSPTALKLLFCEVHAAHLYRALYYSCYSEELPNIYQQPLVII